MKFTVDQIADLIEGTVNGNGATLISNFDKIEEGKSGSISFLSNPKYESFLYQTDASAVIISKDLALKKPVKTALIRVSDPYLAFTILLQKYQELVENKETGIQVPSYVADSAHISENVFVGRFTFVDAGSQIGKNSQIYDRVSIGKNVTIGCDCTIFPGVVIYKDCVIGNNVVIHANSVIGSDGFGHAPQADGTFKSIPQLGNVVIEDDVSIGSNTTIDRATMDQQSSEKELK
jgi:UDP-3-O-[3-hydroxymyristoyl] glucosamine N-acyltransferase